MPSLGTAFLLLLLFIGVEFVKSNGDSVFAPTTIAPGYTPSPVDKSSVYKSDVYCDFVKKSCSWSATGSWKWDSGDANSAQLDGPLARSKWYQYTPLVANFNKDPKTDKKSYDKQSLTSPELEAPLKGANCFAFNFYTLLSEASNDGITLFLVDIDDEKNKTAIWAHGNSAIDDWLEARVDVFTNKKFKLMFEAYGRHGFVGVEKFKLNSGSCDDKRCDFESGMCTGWTDDSQPAGDDFKVIKAGTTTFKHPFDHTSHSSFGHFAYSSGPVTSGSVAQARLISQEMDHLKYQCLTFYFMRTSDDVSLKLLQRFSGNSSYQTLWQSNSTHSFNQWMAVTQTLTISDKMQFIIEADYTKDADLKTGVAIDDVLMQPYSCDDQVSCTFVKKFCGWEPNRDVGLQWSVGSGRVERADKLKKKEKISTYSSLLYTDFTTLEDDDTDSMELISQPIQPHPEGGYCLHLDINVIALGPKDDISLSQMDPNDKRTVIWKFSDLKKDPKDSWIRNNKIWVPNLSGGFASRLTLTAKSSTPYTRVAIDSLHLYKGTYLCGGVSGVPTIPPRSTTPIPPTTVNPYASMTCDFENYKNCEWKSPGTNTFMIGSPETIKNVPKRYLPQKDNTLKSEKGHFAYAFNLKSTGKLDVAQLIMPFPTDEKSTSICVDFAYFYYTSGGGSGATLNIANATNDVPIWRAPPGISNTWHRVRFSYTFSGKSRDQTSIQFKTTLVQGVLAVDDIMFSKGYCKYDVSARIDRVCDFEDGKTCLFEPAYNPIGKHWRVYEGVSMSVPDRTTRTLNGHYYGFNFQDIPQDKKLTSAIETVSKTFYAGSRYEQCIRFSYMLQDVYQNTTVFGYKIEKHDSTGWGDEDSGWAIPEVIKSWEISGNTNKLWFTHRVPVTWTSDYTVKFYIRSTASKDDSRNAMIFIDDFTLSFDACRSTGCNFNDGDACSLEPIPITDKHIEKDFVPPLVRATIGSHVINSYLNSNVEQLWQIYSAQNEDPSNSPQYPVRTSTSSRFGNYLLMTADDDWQRGIVATERFAYNTTTRGKPHMCLSFHVNKPKDTYLQVFKGDSFGRTNELMWLHNKESRDWEQINIMIQRADDNDKTMDVYFYFVGTMGENGKKGYIAIDDYAVTNDCDGPPSNQLPTDIPVTDSSGNIVTRPTDPSSTGTFHCKTSGKDIPISKVCDGVKDCGTSGEDEKLCGSCNFSDHDFCGYQNVIEKPSTKWKFGDEYPDYKKGVTFGDYVEARTDPHINFDDDDEDELVAILESPVLRGSYSFCHVSFSYRPNGTAGYGNILKLYFLNLETKVKTTLYESNYNNIDNLSWTQISINLGRIHHEHKLGFRGEFGTNDFYAHSLKYLSRTNCDAPKPWTSSDSCSEDDGSFMCENKVCIDANQKCDFVDDCGDNSDEKNCDTSKMTSFTEGYKSWAPNPVGSFNKNGYQIKSAKDFYNYRMGPMYDHTDGAEGVGGKFLFFRQNTTPKDKSKPITAELESMYFKHRTNCRMTFFHFKNSKNATIMAFLQDMSKPDDRILLNEYGSADNSWSKAMTSFYRAVVGNTYKVIITSSIEVYDNKGGKPMPYIAIDDISFSKECEFLPSGDVPTLPTLPGGITQTFAPDTCSTVTCKNKKGDRICVTADQMCDFVNDCDDGRDEKNCGECDFNSDMCEWSSPGLRRRWRQQIASTSPSKAPKQDASGVPAGGYAAIYSPGVLRAQEGSELPAKMTSPIINARMNPDCSFRFSYYSNGGGTLTISRKATFTVTPFIKIDSSTNGDWKSYSFSIGSQWKGFQMQIEGFSDTRYLFLLDMFLDNFKMVNCNPSSNPVRPDGSTIAPGSDATTSDVSCDFEADNCGWITINRGDSERRGNFERLRDSNSEPGNDHTSLLEPKPSRSGTWLGISKLDSQTDVYLRTQQPLAAKKAYCFQFYYYLMGPNTYSKLHLLRTPNTQPPSSLYSLNDYTELFAVNLPKARNWVKAMVEIQPNDTRQYLMFVAEAYQKVSLGLDDFTLTPGTCADQDAGENCDFEASTCGWKPKGDGWTRNSGTIQDHTTGSYKGSVLKATAKPGTESLLDLDLAPVSYFNNSLTDSRSLCVRMFYYMKLADSKTPEPATMLGIRSKRSGANMIPRFKNVTAEEVQNADQLESWSMLSFDSYLHKDSTVEIFANRASDSSVVYIDDVTLGPKCEVNGNCDFETDFCGWTNNFAFSGRFIQLQPNTKWESGRFNKKDCTKGSSQGHYAVFPTFEGGSTSQGLKSPILEAKSASICFEFYYFAMTQPTNLKPSKTALKLTFDDLTHPHKKNGKSVLINGTTDMGWKHIRQEYTNIPKFYRITIELDSDAKYTSDIGIDDINIRNYKCDYSDRPTPTPLPDSEKKLDCNFESDNCNWKASTGFVIGNYAKQNDKYAPKVDHNLGTSDGSYAMAHLQKDTDTFKLETTIQMPIMQDRCLTFWYYEDGESQFTIQIKETKKSYTSYLNRYKSQVEARKKWTLIQTDIPQPGYTTTDESYGLIIEYSSQAKKDFDFIKFAVDDIKVRPGLCSHQTNFVYNFENSFEDLELENIRPINSFATTTYRPAYLHNNAYPSVDHTIGTDDGSFFLFRPDPTYTKANFFENSLAITNLESDRTGEKCVRFAYQISKDVGFGVFGLTDYEYNYDYAHKNKSAVWSSKYPTPKDVWTIAEFNIRFHSMISSPVAKLVFYMNSAQSATNFLALDDIVILNQKCQPMMDCDFEQSRFCSYTPMNRKDKNNMNFGVFTGPAEDPNWPGPKYDHTKGSYGGAYLYLTAYRTSADSGSHSARIVSGPRDVVKGKSYCLSLYTQLNTQDLSVTVSLLRLGPDISSDAEMKAIGTLTNMKQTSWTSWNIQLNDSNIGTAQQIQLVIEGTLGSSSKGAIAIDDIQLLDGTCSGGSGVNPSAGLICEDGKQLNESQICNFVKDCASGLDEASCGTCDFENGGSCGWKNISAYSRGFEMVQANLVKDQPSAPTSDADAKSSGHYMLAASTGKFSFGLSGEMAVNQDQPSMFLKLAYKSCVMTFDYYIKTIGKPKLEVRVGTNKINLATVYKIVTQTNGVWRKGYAHIANRYRPFFVDINTHSSEKGVVGIDNVNFVNCSLPPPKSSCDSTEFRCSKNQFCISKDSVCDYINDCGDDTDETECFKLPLRCNFESTLYSCHIVEESGSYSNGHWKLFSPRDSFSISTNSLFEPEADNTLRTPYGHYYMLVPPLGGKQAKGQFASGMINAKSGQTCTLRFFYYIADLPDQVASTSLEVRIRYATNTSPEKDAIQTYKLDATAEVQQRWNKAVVTFTYTTPFQVIFNGILGSNTSRIAIDDMTYDEGCQNSNAAPVKQSTTVAPITDGPHSGTDGPANPTDGTVTDIPKVTNNSKKSSGHGGTIAAGILIPLFVVAAAVGGFLFYKKRQTTYARDDTFSFSINRIGENDM